LVNLRQIYVNFGQLNEIVKNYQGFLSKTLPNFHDLKINLILIRR